MKRGVLLVLACLGWLFWRQQKRLAKSLPVYDPEVARVNKRLHDWYIAHQKRQEAQKNPAYQAREAKLKALLLTLQNTPHWDWEDDFS